MLIVSFHTACGDKQAESYTAGIQATVTENEANQRLGATDERAPSLYKNVTIVFIGVMTISFNKTFQGMAGQFSETFGRMADDETALQQVDEKIKHLDGETTTKLNEIIEEISARFDDAVEQNQVGFSKMFSHPVWEEGVNLAESGILPKGFSPLTAKLGKKELWYYILYLSAKANDEDDLVVQTYQQLMLWLQKAGPQLEADPEIKAFMEAMKQKNKKAA